MFFWASVFDRLPQSSKYPNLQSNTFFHPIIIFSSNMSIPLQSIYLYHSAFIFLMVLKFLIVFNLFFLL